ncbi:MAG: hypothetical protein AAF907_01180 [Planctomycetota bacterium]
MTDAAPTDPPQPPATDEPTPHGLVVGLDGPTDLSLPALFRAAPQTGKRRFDRDYGRGLTAFFFTGAWSFAVLIGTSAFGIGMSQHPAIAGLLMWNLWAVGTSMLGLRFVAGLVQNAVWALRNPQSDGGKYLPDWGGRFAGYAQPLVLMTATAGVLPIVSLLRPFVAVEVVSVIALFSLVAAPTTVFTLFWPLPFRVWADPNLTFFSALPQVWRFCEGVRGPASAAGAAALSLLICPAILPFAAGWIAGEPMVIFPILLLMVFVWPLVTPTAFLLLAHTHDRIVRLELQASGSYEERAPDPANAMFERYQIQ